MSGKRLFYVDSAVARLFFAQSDMINFQNVSKNFDGLNVVKGINFEISEGQVVGLLGPNGAGKTTTLRMMTGVLPASKGTVSVDGLNPIESIEIKKSIGYLPENNPIYDDMTVEEWLKYWNKIKQSESEVQISTLVAKTGLQSVYYRPISELSKGYKQRVGLAQAMLGDPRVLVLDEPTEGLDPNQRSEIHGLIKDLGKKRTVVISSHILGEITKMCNRVMIMNQGQIAADGSPDQLISSAGGQQTVEVELKGTGIVTVLKAIKGVTEVSKDENKYVLTVAGKKDIRLEVFEMAKAKKWELYELTRRQADLEEVFKQLTK